MAKKTTGLGADAIFGNKAPQQPLTTPAAQPDKIRTTVMLDSSVVILLNRLKEKSILDGDRKTQGEIIEEAIKTLASYKNIRP